MASNNIARLGVVLGLDTAEFTASIDKAISENRKLGREMERSTKKALEDAKNLKYATEDYGKTVTKVQELERNIAEGRYKNAQQSAIDELRKRAVAYDAIAASATKANKVTEGLTQQQRMGLMYQTTDFFTQVASGQNVMIAALQQGGQLKDQMGGLGNMFKALGTILTPVRLALGGVAAAIGTIGFAIYKGRQEFNDFNNTVALTGNYAQLTRTSFLSLAQSLSTNTRASITDAKVILSEMMNAGQFTGKTFSSVSQTIQKYAELSGLTQKEAASKLIPSLDGSASSAKKLNDQFNFLTLEQYKHIEALAAQGKKQEAIIETSNLLLSSLNKQKTEISDLTKIVNLFIRAWEGWKSIGEPDSLDKQIVAKTRLIIQLRNNLEAKAKSGLPEAVIKGPMAEIEATIKRLEGEVDALIAKGRAAADAFDESKGNKPEIEDYAATGGADQTKKNAAKLAKIRADIAYEEALVTASERERIDLEAAKKTAELIAEYNEKYSAQDRRARGKEINDLLEAEKLKVSSEAKRKQSELTRRYALEEADTVKRAMQQIDELVSESEKEYEKAKATAMARTDSLQLLNDELLLKMKLIGFSEEEIELEKIRLEYIKKRRDIESKPISSRQKEMEIAELDRQEAIEKANVSIKQNMQDIAKYNDSIWSNMNSAIDNFVKNGKLSFADLARSIIQDLIAIQMKAAMMKMFSGFNFGSLFAQSNKDVTIPMQPGGGYAEGGEPPVGIPSLVGEKGPEIFIPRTAGTIIPNNALSSIGSTTNVTNYNIQAIDTKSFEDRILSSSKAVWAANAYGAKNLAIGRGRT